MVENPACSPQSSVFLFFPIFPYFHSLTSRFSRCSLWCVFHPYLLVQGGNKTALIIFPLSRKSSSRTGRPELVLLGLRWALCLRTNCCYCMSSGDFAFPTAPAPITCPTLHVSGYPEDRGFWWALWGCFLFSFKNSRALDDVGLCIFALLERRRPGSCQGASFMSTLKQKKIETGAWGVDRTNEAVLSLLFVCTWGGGKEDPTEYCKRM